MTDINDNDWETETTSQGMDWGTATAEPIEDDIPKDPVAVTAIQLVLIFVIVLSNGLILAAIKKSSKLHVMTFYLLGNVAAADGSFAFSFAIRFLLKDQFGGYGCLVSNFLILLSCGSSLSLVLVTCVHNFIAVKFYVYARQGFKGKTVKIIIVCIWVFWIVLSGSSIPTADLTSPNEENLCYIGNAYYSRYWMGALSIVCYLKFMLVLIFQLWTIGIIRNQEKSLQSLMRAQIQLVSNASKLRKTRKAAKVTGIITLVLLLTLFSWGPLLIANSIIALCPDGCGIEGRYISLTASLLFFNNIGNVFIYAVKSREFRESFLKMFRRNNAVTVASITNQNDGTTETP